MKRITAKSPNSGAFSLGFQVVSERVSRISETRSKIVYFPAQMELILDIFTESRTIGCSIVVRFGTQNSGSFPLGKHMVSAFRKVRHEIVYIPNGNDLDFGDSTENRFIFIGNSCSLRARVPCCEKAV